MNSADHDRLDRDVIAESDGTHERAPDHQVDDAGKDGDGKRRQHDPVGVEPVRVP